MPEVHDPYTLIAFIALLLSNAFQMYQNNRIKTQGDKIELQTNGMIATSVKHANEAGHATGELAGAIKEQARAAAVLALAEEVAAAKLALAGEVAAARTAIANEAAVHLATIRQGSK
jgi:hypothetical protein